MEGIFPSQRAGRQQEPRLGSAQVTLNQQSRAAAAAGGLNLCRFEFGSDGSCEKRKKIQDFRGFSAPAWELSIPGTFAHSATVTALQKKNGADLN